VAEKVKIDIDIDADTKEIDKTSAALMRMGREADALEKDTDRLDKSNKRLGSQFKVNRKIIGKFADYLDKTVSFIFKAFAAQTAIAALGLVAITLAFKVGAAAAKAWQFALAGVAGAMAIVTAAAATGAAAYRQYQGAVAAVNYQAGALGNRQQMAIGGLRSIQSDADLAVFGLKGVSAAFSGITKSASYTGDMAGSLKALGDFAVASGDMEKGMAAAGTFLGELRKNGKITGTMAKNAGDLGSEFEVAIKNAQKLGATTEQGFLTALKEGKLNKNVVGLLDGVNNTLFGQLKGYVTKIFSLGADMGQSFLPGLQVAFDKIFGFVRVGLLRIGASLRAYDSGSFIDGLVEGSRKLIDWTATFFGNYLPKAEGFLSKIGEWGGGLRDGFRSFVAYLEPLKKGGQVIIDSFMPIFSQIFGGVGESVNSLSTILVENRSEFVGFGEAVSKIFAQGQRLFQGMKQILVDIMPALTMIANMIANISKQIIDIAGPVAKLLFGGKKEPGEKSGGVMDQMQGMGGIAALLLGRQAVKSVGSQSSFAKGKGYSFWGGRGKSMGMPGSGGKGGPGGPGGGATSATTGTMTVNATTVNVNGGGTGSKFARGQGGGFSGSGGGSTAGVNKAPPPLTKGQQMAMKARGAASSAGNAARGALPFAMMAATPFMADEAQGSMMAGGMVGAMTGNPLLGGAVAGIGTAATAQTAKGGAIAGAIGGATGGAVIGAMIGSLFPGPGTVIGGVIGGLVGGIAGGIGGGAMGASNDEKSYKERNKLGREGITNSYMSSIYGGVAARETPEQIMQGLAAAPEQFNKLFSETGDSIYTKLYGDKGNGGGLADRIKTSEADRKAFIRKETGADDVDIESQKVGNKPEKSKKAIYESIEDAGKEFDDALTDGIKDFRDQRDVLLNSMVDSGLMTADTRKALQTQGLSADAPTKGQDDQASAKSFSKAQDRAADSATKVAGVLGGYFKYNLDNLSQASGKTEEEILKLSDSMGLNLYDATLTAVDGLEKLGLAIPKTIDELNESMRKASFEGIARVFDEVFAPQKAQEAINQGGEDIRNTQGPLSDEQKRTFQQTVAEQAMNLFPDDVFAAQAYFVKQMGPNSPQWNNPDGPLYGRRKEFQAPENKKAYDAVNEVFRTSQEDAARGQVVASLEARSGQTLTGPGAEALQKYLDTATTEQLKFITTQGLKVTQETTKEQRDAAKLLGPDAGKATADFLIAGLGIDVDLATTLDTAQGAQERLYNSLNAQQRAIVDATQLGVKTGFSNPPAWYTKNPGWYDGLVANGTIKPAAPFNLPVSGGYDVGGDYEYINGNRNPLYDPNAKVGEADTASSRLQRTMSKHNQLDGGIAGKRSVVSSLRTDGLGSINSDHATGNAYDLTGQNLGAYQQLTQDNGGFAEFHNAGGRHLHVVPGAGAPVGDTQMPIVSPTTAPAMIGNSGTYNFNITAGPNASPEEIARAVETIINRKTRSRKERI
jgi:hypothetical protein